MPEATANASQGTISGRVALLRQMSQAFLCECWVLAFSFCEGMPLVIVCKSLGGGLESPICMYFMNYFSLAILTGEEY